jgi:hypothetical protein
MMRRNIWIPLVAAIGWAALLLPAALYLPIEDPQNFSHQVDGHTVERWVSLTTGNGKGILFVVAIPLILSVAAGSLLLIQAGSNGRICWWISRCLAVLILAGAFVGTITFLVGIFVAPVGACLLVSCANLRQIQLSSAPR